MTTPNHQNTIFLTPEEDERIRTTLKGKLQKCQALKGQPRESGDPQYRLNQVRMASLMSDFAVSGREKQQNAIIAFAVGSPYPPCTAYLEDLKPMGFSELRMETHHPGRVLIAKRVADVVKLTAYSWTMVQELGSKESERLEIWLHKKRHGKEILELGELLRIKEPYFTLSDEGEPTLRVEHPSDLVIGRDEGGSTGVVDPEGVPVAALKKAREYKDEGNTALRQHDLLLSHAKYTYGLNLLKTENLTEEELAHDLFRNRAHVNLLLNHLDEAKADALASFTGLDDELHRELDGKAYMRAGSAAYNLGEFREARTYFEKQEKLMPGSKDAIARRRKTDLRLKEQTIGAYDFRKIRAGLSTGRPQVDAASFSKNVEIRESSGKGRGLFVTSDLKPGEIILAEKAFCAVWGHEDEALTAMTYDKRDDKIRVFPAGLPKSIVQKLQDNPSLVERVLDLFGDYGGIGKELLLRNSNPVIDIFQIHDIVTRNAFGLHALDLSKQNEQASVGNASTALWILAAYVNHSCVPNATKESIGDLMVLRATQSIRAGDEITHSYDASSDFDARSAALITTWGFTCTCALCTVERMESPEVRKKRRELENEAKAFVTRYEAVGAKKLTIVKARRLFNSINNTYDNSRHKDMPRRALLEIQKWLNEALD